MAAKISVHVAQEDKLNLHNFCRRLSKNAGPYPNIIVFYLTSPYPPVTGFNFPWLDQFPPLAASQPLSSSPPPPPVSPIIGSEFKSLRERKAFSFYTYNSFRVWKNDQVKGDAKKRRLLRSNWCWLRGNMGCSRDDLSLNSFTSHLNAAACKKEYIRSGGPSFSNTHKKKNKNLTK